MKTAKQQLEHDVILESRNYGISTVLYRHAVGDILGLNVTDMECLGVLFHQGVATPTQLAAHTGLSSGATTAMLDRLEKSGLIRRSPNPDDRRGTHIEIVSSTAKKLAPLFKPGREAQAELLASYSETELNVLLDFFGRATVLWNDERQRVNQRTAK